MATIYFITEFSMHLAIIGITLPARFLALYFVALGMQLTLNILLFSHLVFILTLCYVMVGSITCTLLIQGTWLVLVKLAFAGISSIYHKKSVSWVKKASAEVKGCFNLAYDGPLKIFGDSRERELKLNFVPDILDNLAIFLDEKSISICFFLIPCWTIFLLSGWLVKGVMSHLRLMAFTLLLTITWVVLDPSFEYFMKIIKVLRKTTEVAVRVQRAIVILTVNASKMKTDEALIKYRHVKLLTSIFILEVAFKLKLLELRYSSFNEEGKKMAILRSRYMSFAKVFQDVSLPSLVRYQVNSHLSSEETMSLLKDLDYPIGDVQLSDPITGLAEGKFDSKDVLLSGSSWRIHLPQIRTYIQRHFNGLREGVQEYRFSLEYADLNNQVESISRYFEEFDVEKDFDNKLLDAVWDVLGEIYHKSKLTPLPDIYRAWNKSFNVGVFASSEKRNVKGGLRKMTRREDIARFETVKDYIAYWEKLVAHYGLMENFSQFFTKMEYLPHKKWSKNKVRTPVASMLPQYLSQMLFSKEPNHRFRYVSTPIKVGMPLNGATMSEMFSKHDKFDKHHAGDFTAFDSTVTGFLVGIIKAVRKRGFKDHKQFEAISKLIDLNYERIQTSKMVSANSGNIYQKKQGLMTGHASTSSDNSMACVSIYLCAWISLTGKSAEEFKRYNELSCYGDDHLLSIASDAPKIWNFRNIQKTMDSYGVTLREEVDTNMNGGALKDMPFLSKFSRRPNFNDRTTFYKVIGTEPPARIVYHDPEKLVGKLMAATPSRNPQDNAKRIISFMYLCAHNEDVYRRANTGLNNIFKLYPKVEVALGKYVPSYERVLKTWYNEKNNITELDDDIPDDGFAHYGELTVRDVIGNYLSLIPDIVNPVMISSGYNTYLQKLFKSNLSWPLLLLERANSCSTEASLASTVGRTCYDFLIERQSVYTRNETTDSLLVRHWIFLWLRSTKPNRGILSFLDYAQRKIGQANFILNGKLMPSYESFGMPFYNITLVILLSFINVPDLGLNVLMDFEMPDLSKFIRVQLSSFINNIWASIPPSFENLRKVQTLELGEIALATAGTGTGKSTSMIEFLAQFLIPRYKKIIVIEPRSLLVIGLVDFMNKKFNRLFSGLTSGMSLDRRSDVWYVTPQEYFTHYDEMRNKDFLLVVDEAHTDEPFMEAILRQVETREQTALLLTATPSERLRRIKDYDLPIALKKQWTVDRIDKTLHCNNKTPGMSYRSEVSGIINSDILRRKYLVFVDSFAEQNMLADKLDRKVSLLNSKVKEVVLDAEVIIATSVADAGITIPDVDVVITKDITPDILFPQTRQYIRLPAMIINQRIGRTGRTNNGKAIIFNVDIETLTEPSRLSNKELFAAWSNSSAPFSVGRKLGIFDPKEIFPYANEDKLEKIGHLLDKDREGAKAALEEMQSGPVSGPVQQYHPVMGTAGFDKLPYAQQPLVSAIATTIMMRNFDKFYFKLMKHEELTHELIFKAAYEEIPHETGSLHEFLLKTGVESEISPDIRYFFPIEECEDV